ncbi:M56 family metallopeptidase [Novosphingobium sp. BL-8A]|uniref:M56 family metallopeptidase n=1 Tax=Novosphingobium sp. BL-8A TaxID=3127639 RepID=UPI003757EA76
MTEWLVDTLVMTGVLMALILMVRRPVARWFGPAAAYALWALPMIRLILPPLALPRGLIPHISIAAEPATAVAGQMAAPAASVGDMTAGASMTLAATATTSAPPIAEPLAAVPAADPGLLAHVPWAALLLAVWLGGAAVFLAWRFWNYHLMRQEILGQARLVARSGDVKIFESPAAAAPLAFGVFEKFVALPQGFLAGVDSESSDFAIAHELEHHAGNDLLAIMALQPLFALHWFNPLGWAAWRALRSDQEAACDARVMAGCGREMRARYGRLIASFAAGTRLTLAAPMAGTLAGEKPIIQRLKALGRAEVSPARKVAARSLFALAIVSVPLTATVTYAAMEDAPKVPEAPEAPVAPAAPAARSVAPAQAIRPVDPDAVDSDTVGSAEVGLGAVPAAPMAPPAPEAPEAPALPQHVAGAPMPPVPAVPPQPPEPPASVSLNRAIARSVQASVAQAMRGVPEVKQRVSSDGKVQTIRIVARNADGSRVYQQMTIDSRCPADSARSEARSSRGASSTVICTGTPREAAEASLQATKAIADARAAVAANRHLSAEMRSEITAELNAEMARTRAEVDRARAEADRARTEAANAWND